MSVLSEKIRVALFAKSNVAALVGANKLTGIYNAKAPKNAAFPFGVFSYQAPGANTPGFNGQYLMETGLWLFKVIADDQTVYSPAQEPQAFAASMANTWESTIGRSLTLSGGGTVMWVAREADMPEFEEQQSDRIIYHRGFMVRITAKE